MHPRKNGAQLIACQQQVEVLRKNITFHLKASVPSYRSPGRTQKETLGWWDGKRVRTTLLDVDGVHDIRNRTTEHIMSLPLSCQRWYKADSLASRTPSILRRFLRGMFGAAASTSSYTPSPHTTGQHCVSCQLPAGFDAVSGHSKRIDLSIQCGA